MYCESTDEEGLKTKKTATTPAQVPEVLAEACRHRHKARPVRPKVWRKWIKLMKVPTCNDRWTEISTKEVKAAFMAAGSSRAAGLDGVPVMVWKDLMEESQVVEMVRKAWNWSVSKDGKLPTSYKHGVTTMLYKMRGEVEDALEYRPICVSPVD